eukprot:11192983-Heterocapsa_arctica.AAC.1
MKDGLLFYRSRNGVLLTEGLEGTVDPRFIIKICDLRTSLVLYTGASASVMPLVADSASDVRTLKAS